MSQNNERGTEYRLFHQRFHCRIQRLALATDFELNHFGLRVSGDKKFDRNAGREHVQVYLTCVEMAEHFSKGFTVYITNSSDTKEIYEIISNHLQAWKNFLTSTPVIQIDPPLEDLLLLDEFAQSIYEHARWHLDATWVESPLLRAFGNTLGLARFTQIEATLAQRKVQDPDDPVPAHVPAEYQSIAHVFRDTLIELDTRGN